MHGLVRLMQADDRRELADLQAAEEAGAVTNSRIAGDRADIVLAEGQRRPAQRVRIEQGIAVDADQDLVPCQQRAGIERGRLAVVLGEMDDAQPRHVLGQCVQHFVR